MKKIVTAVLFACIMAGLSIPAFAASVIASYNCELKEGKKLEELQAVNSRGLKWVRENVNPNIESSVGSPIVGDLEHFIFIDTYPDLATWAATQAALDSDAASELEDMFNDVSECTKNRLWKVEPTQ